MDRYWSPRVLELAWSRSLVESYFIKLNHPRGEWAAWVKYTFLARPGNFDTVGECWFIFFEPDAQMGARTTAWKETFELANFNPSLDRKEFTIGPNRLSPGRAAGELAGGEVRFDLNFASAMRSLRLLKRPFYSPLMPGSKLTTPYPGTVADGEIEVRGRKLKVEGFPLSLGHNWGRKHTESYVWGQCQADTEKAPLFFEGCSIPAPVDWREQGGSDSKFTVGKVRLGAKEIRFNGYRSMRLNKAFVEPGHWSFSMRKLRWRLAGELHWEPELVAGLRYIQPDGAIRSCLNSMMASGSLTLSKKGKTGRLRVVQEVAIRGSAALEFVTPTLDHGFDLLV